MVLSQSFIVMIYILLKRLIKFVELIQTNY